jgi:hypothetical protein
MYACLTLHQVSMIVLINVMLKLNKMKGEILLKISDLSSDKAYKIESPHWLLQSMLTTRGPNIISLDFAEKPLLHVWIETLHANALKNKLELLLTTEEC